MFHYVALVGPELKLTMQTRLALTCGNNLPAYLVYNTKSSSKSLLIKGSTAYEKVKCRMRDHICKSFVRKLIPIICTKL